ncbi:13674_t:CDS:2, partial [Gigaspora margarita]
MAKLQELRAETLVREDKNSLTESNKLVSNLQAGMSLGHPISVLIDEFNEKQADGIEEVTRIQYRESLNPTEKSNKESENSLANTNEIWMKFFYRDLGESNYKKSWTSLFTKLTRGPSTYSTYSVRNQITTKNSRAAFFEICTLIYLSMNKIAVVLNKCIGNDIIGIKPYFTKGVRTHLEIIFKFRKNIQKYSTNGINMFNQTFLDYIPTNSRNSYLSIKLKNVPIDFQDDIMKEICETFDHKLKAEYRKYKKNKIALSERSALYNSTDLSNNTFINSEQTVENNCTNIQDHLSQEEIVVTQVQQNNSILTGNQQEESSDLDDIETNTHIADLETLLQEEKDQEFSIQDSNSIANKNMDNTQQETEFTLVNN